MACASVYTSYCLHRRGELNIPCAIFNKTALTSTPESTYPGDDSVLKSYRLEALKCGCGSQSHAATHLGQKKCMLGDLLVMFNLCIICMCVFRDNSSGHLLSAALIWKFLANTDVTDVKPMHRCIPSFHKAVHKAFAFPLYK